MNFLYKFLEFTTIKKGRKKLKEAYDLRDKMGGALYYNALNDDCKEISAKLEKLERKNLIIIKNETLDSTKKILSWR
jgi:hypothetical protein